MALEVVAGQPATSAQFNALVPKYLRQASDQALATTTLTNHNTFAAIAFGAGETWHVVACIHYDCATASNGYKSLWTMTGGLSFQSRRALVGLGPSETTASGALGNFQMRDNSGTVGHGGTTSTGTAALSREEFIVATTTAGTLTLQWAQQAATSGVTTVRAGSFLVAHRLA